jgi:hypothetical protein
VTRSSNERFREKLGPPDENGCVLWTAGAQRATGFGRFHIRAGCRKVVYAHRAAFAMYRLGGVEREPDVDGYILQTCRRRLCCAEAHLRRVDTLAGSPGVRSRRTRRLHDGERETIRRLRREGMTQVEVAEELGVTQATISRLEIAGRVVR